jgi:hypothetical protein
METVKIVLLCILSAIIFGILHDQVTARACVEYFTIGHPPIFDTDSPTLLAFGWGIIATWWVGLILGILATSVAPAWLLAEVHRQPIKVAAITADQPLPEATYLNLPYHRTKQEIVLVRA